MKGSVFRQGKGSWGVRVSAGFDPVTGKRRRIFLTVRGTKRDAERELARLVYEVETGTDLDPVRLLTADYFKRWLDHMKTRVRPATWDAYESRVRVHVIPRMGAVALGKVRPAQIQALLDDMIRSGQSPRSVLHCYRVLRGAFRQARRWLLIPNDPTEAIPAPRASRPRLHIPDPTELKKLLRACAGIPQGIPIIIDVATGLRRGELLGLRWKDVDFAARKIRITSTLQRVRQADGGSALVLVEPKTALARREVALPLFALETLKRHRRQQAERRLQWGEAWHDRDFVFDRGDGRPLDPSDFTRAFKRVAAKVGLSNTRLHDIRHGFATALLAQGVHPKIVSEALGHSSVSFTLDTYSHVVPGLQEAVAQAIQSLWEPDQDPVEDAAEEPAE